ncbi:SusC/RagA family TonB-linked outer membrane protein [Prevotella sp. E9-3]|uniref:SusC/RagA family TonB-linked outer membrane protein n=1 Tax=Prevotella sp. E9-3 TaxID=2913621 RepID=UPI001EDAE624|nr:SusC/RagA family TonB-linked outer membrane protein [Prevotella sp. E9-3]UKK48153.1 SusC/RagA family TonB-linked outer membrane protein [Prevotella sp. E9-3]
MEKRLSMLLVSLFLLVGGALAQTRVNGTVVSQEDGQAVIGASVFIIGTNLGTVTDANGKFTIVLPNDKNKIRVSYVGMVTQTLTAKNGITVRLASDATSLDEVVVTALGITRQERTLGYAATTLKTDDLTEAHNTNVTNALAGKVAGVSVQSTSGDPGQATSVVIRGFSSINGSNQPLYVVDGVPLQNTTFNGEAGNLNTGMGFSNTLGGISNINPNDIESMTVLKGAAATALYGSRAANGAIIITTKTGKKGESRNFTINYEGNVTARNIANLPEFQNKWGQGWNGGQTFIENGSWGPALDGSQQVFGPIWNNQQMIHEYSAAEDNIKDFFDTGISTSHSISLSGVSADNKATYYLSYSYTKDDGIMPTDADSYKRNTIATRGSFEATDWLKLSSSVNFATSSTNTVGNFQGTSVIDGLYEFPRDLSLVDHKDLSSAFNTPEAWLTPYGITNPYWALENNFNQNNSKQINGKIQADITPLDQLTLSYRFGFDYTDYDLKVGEPEIALDDALITDDMGYAPSNMNQAGAIYNRYLRKYELNHDFLANWSDKYFNQKLDVNANAGVNINERYQTYMDGMVTNLAIYNGYWNLNNGSNKQELLDRQSKRRLVGLFGDVTFGWDEMLYLELTARNDWSSTLPEDKNSYFYSGVTGSWIFTKLLPKNKILDFGKLRLAYGKTGNDADPYSTLATFTQAYANGYYGSDIIKFPFNGVGAFQNSSSIGSTSLKPEMTTEFEVGLNMQFFDNRFGFDAAFYNRVTSDQIFSLPTDPATGYYYKVMNVGEVRNRGIELLINTTPIRTKNWRWDLSFNFAKNWNKVLEMPETLDRIEINRFSAGNDAVYMYAEKGKPVGTLYTYLPTYTPDGKLIVGKDGQPVLTSDVQDTGKTTNYDWTGGINTSITFQNLTLSASLDIRKGGYMFSRTKNLMQFTGNGTISTYNDRNPFIIPNSAVVTATDANGNPTAWEDNNTPIYLGDGSYQTYFNDYGYGQGGEAYLIDRSFVKLRNVNLTWNLPKKWASSIYLTNVAVSVFCNNVFVWTAKDNYYIDPEVSSWGSELDGQFGELYSNPTCRTYGASLNVKF